MADGNFSGSDRETLRRINQDMYLGNGKPGMTVRMAAVEDDVKDHAVDIALLKKYREESMLFVNEVRALTTQREKTQKWWFALVGTLIAIGTLLLGILTYEHASGRSVLNLQSDVMNAERLQANPWR